MPRLLVGGCRATPGGLHLGHVYGCFSDVSLEPDESYVFVVSDMQAVSMDSLRSATLKICLDVLAWTDSDSQVYLVRESALRQSLTPIVDLIERIMPVSLLEAAHPHRSQIKLGAYRGSIGDYMFPVHQASFLLGLGCTLACFNDDNRLVVEFAQKTARRLNRHLERDVFAAHLELLERVPTRLHGYDGLRMSKTNCNPLFLDAAEGQIRRYVRRTIGLATGNHLPIDAPKALDFEVACARIVGGDDSWLAISDEVARINLLSELLCKRFAHFRDIRQSLATTGDLAVQDALRRGELRAKHFAATMLTGLLG
jgi:tryptophanyl-tRNA synthetase